MVDVKDVLERIIQTTASSMIAPNMDIQIEVYGEPLLLASRPATALTLIVNELVQNALEHAFNGRTQGAIEVSLGHAPEELIIIVRDNGSGLSTRLSSLASAWKLHKHWLQMI